MIATAKQAEVGFMPTEIPREVLSDEAISTFASVIRVGKITGITYEDGEWKNLFHPSTELSYNILHTANVRGL